MTRRALLGVSPAHLDDRGESLIEVLMAIGIMAVAFVVLLTGLTLSAKASALDGRQVQAQALLKSWADRPVATYAPCPAAYALPAVPSGLTASIPSIEYWDLTANANAGGFISSCPASDSGIERLTLQLAASAEQLPGFTTQLKVIVRKPCQTAC